MNILKHLIKFIRKAADYNRNTQVAPACILWADAERQWESAIPALQVAMPELFVLGDYAPEKRTGPAIWLRCVLAGTIQDLHIPNDATPILYLPEVSRQDLRAVESCPPLLKPLAELQYRGALWSQINGKDWTVRAYLTTALQLDVAQDRGTKEAAVHALPSLLQEKVSTIQAKRLEKEDFYAFLIGDDVTKLLLQYLNNADAFQKSQSIAEWNAFRNICKAKWNFDPQNEGFLTGCHQLATQDGAWKKTWERYAEAPKQYPHIATHLRTCDPVRTLSWELSDGSYDRWPQWNEDQEKSLQYALLSLSSLPLHEAKKAIMDLEQKHMKRRSLVWAELGFSPLALALKYIWTMVESMSDDLASGTLDSLAERYASQGWKVDNAALQALQCIEKQGDIEAVSMALHALYLPWLENSALHLQQEVHNTYYLNASHKTTLPFSAQHGDCYLFVDGLRFDLAKRLSASLLHNGFSVAESRSWAALPTVTATGKAAVSPVYEKLQGLDTATDFEPSIAETGQSLKGGYHLKKLMENAGWTLLPHDQRGDGRSIAWTEIGDIDSEGHHRGWKLAKHCDTIVQEIHDRIAELLQAGWRYVHVVTDHGWLLLPKGLPKKELPYELVESKWARCAWLKENITTSEWCYPWFWNNECYVALAQGVHCYKKGEEYTHGGLSLQEALTLRLRVTRNNYAGSVCVPTFNSIIWRGLRCTVLLDGLYSDVRLDIRLQANDPSKTVISSIKNFKEDGTASVLVEDDMLEGKNAFIVLLDANGALLLQKHSVIGGEVS